MSNVVDGKVKSVEIRVTTTGGAGVSAGNTTSAQIIGQVLDVEVIYHGSAPNTTDVIVEGSITGVDLYAKVNTLTSVKKAIAKLGANAASSTGAVLTSDVTPQKVCIAEPIKVSVAQSDDLTDCVIVRVTYRTVACQVVKVTTTGVAGSASGNASSDPITGQLVGILLDYHASAPGGTTDVLVTGATSGIQLYAKTNTVTDIFVVPVVFAVDLANTALTADVTPQNVCIGEAVKVAIAQSDALTNCVTAYIFYIPCEAETLRITTTGGAGVSAGSANSLRQQGEILGVLINYNALAPATTDVTIKAQAPSANHAPANILAVTDSATDAYLVPARFSVTNADVALTNDVTPQLFAFGHAITASVAQCDDLADAVQVTVFTRYGS